MSDTANAHAELLKCVRSGDRAGIVFWAEAFSSALEKKIQRSRQEDRQHFQQLIDLARFAELSVSRESALAGLDDGNPLVRQCALFILRENFPDAPQLADRLRVVIAHDPDLDVREWAIISLASLFRGTENPATGAFLARFVLSEHEPESLRLFAYRGLLMLRPGPMVEPLLATLRTPAEIDWNIPQAYLASAGAEQE